MFAMFLIIIVLCWVMWHFVQGELVNQRELGRFRTIVSEGEGLERNLNKWFEVLGRLVTDKKSAIKHGVFDSESMEAKLREAGFEELSEHGKFALVRIACYLSWPVIVSFSWLNCSTYYASVLSLFSLAFVVVIPHLVLSRKIVQRREEIQRELPLVIDLTNLATSAGWDVSVALERVVDSLALEYPKHPLIAELRRARWLAMSGYTWSEALDRVSRRLKEDSVTRVVLALMQAIEQGGDRTQQLDGIAQDAQRSYYAVLDKRLAAIPGAALIITMVLFLSYFAILLTPAAVGVKGSFGAM